MSLSVFVGVLPVPAELGTPFVVSVLPEFPSALPSLFTSVPPDSITSVIPSLSESRSKEFGIPSPSKSLKLAGHFKEAKTILSTPTSLPPEPLGWSLKITMSKVVFVAVKFNVILLQTSSLGSPEAGEEMVCVVAPRLSCTSSLKIGLSEQPLHKPAKSSLNL